MEPFLSPPNFFSLHYSFWTNLSILRHTYFWPILEGNWLGLNHFKSLTLDIGHGLGGFYRMRKLLSHIELIYWRNIQVFLMVVGCGSGWVGIFYYSVTRGPCSWNYDYQLNTWPERTWSLTKIFISKFTLETKMSVCPCPSSLIIKFIASMPSLWLKNCFAGCAEIILQCDWFNEFNLTPVFLLWRSLTASSLVTSGQCQIGLLLTIRSRGNITEEDGEDIISSVEMLLLDLDCDWFWLECCDFSGHPNWKIKINFFTELS